MLRGILSMSVLTISVLGLATLPVVAQDKAKDTQVKPAVGQDSSKDKQVKPAVDAGGKKPSADEQKIKPAGLAVGQQPKGPVVQPDDYRSYAPGRQGRPGQYMYAVPTYQGNYVDPSLGYSSYDYGNYGFGGQGHGSPGMCGGYGGYGNYPGAAYSGYPGTANYNLSQQAYWQNNTPRMRVGTYNPQTLAYYGLAADPGAGYGYPGGGTGLGYTPRMRVTPYDNPAYQANVIQPAYWSGTTGISPLYLR